MLGQPAVVQLGHLLVVLHFLPAGLVESLFFSGGSGWKSVHPSVNDAFSENLQSPDPSLEVL